MTDNDIYDSRAKFLYIQDNLERYLQEPHPGSHIQGKRIYWIKNPANIRHFRKLMGSTGEKGMFDTRDTSYIRRLRLFRTLLLVCHYVEKDLQETTREDIDRLIGYANDHNHSVKSKRDFNLDVKFLWKQLFPERDEKGRIDETLTPYAVRHLSGKVDRSKEKMRGDKFSFEEFERLLTAFGDDPRMQCLLTVALESLARPQELLGRKIGDVELHDCYAKIYITEHGKEGVGFLRIIDSFPYLVKWLEEHPYNKNPNAPLFVNTGDKRKYDQAKPCGINKLIRTRCAKIGIHKPITLYSLKRNGITLMRLSGRSDLEIQHTARWTSTKQLKTYDLSNQEDSFKAELIRRGIIQGNGPESILVKKKCLFCGKENGMTSMTCGNCKRPLNREAIELEAREQDEKFRLMNEQITEMKTMISRAIPKVSIENEK